MGKHIGSTVNPVLEKNNHYMTSPFGERTLNGKTAMHNGIDLKNGDKAGHLSGDNIISIADGKVTYVGKSKTRGNYVELQHINGWKTRYLHQKDNSIVVSVKQLVKKGQKLGHTGDTGEGVTAEHLHLAVINPKGNYVDPLPYLLGDKNFDGENWETGVDYITMYEKFKRYSPCVGVNKVPYKRLSAADQKKCNNVGGYAKTKVGVKYKFYEFAFDNKGNRWGCTTNPNKKQKNKHWICVCDKNGDQVKKA